MEYELNPKQEELVKKLNLQEYLDKLVKETDEAAIKELVNKVAALGVYGFYVLRATADVLAMKSKDLKDVLYKLTRERYESVFSFVAPMYERMNGVKENFSLIKTKKEKNLYKYSGLIASETFGII